MHRQGRVDALMAGAGARRDSIQEYSVHRITAFRTSDGQVFEDEMKAGKHEARVLLEQLLEDNSVCRGGQWDPHMVADTLIENADRLLEILSMLRRSTPAGQKLKGDKAA